MFAVLKRLLTLSAALAISSVLHISAVAAVVPIFENGKLSGARNVTIGDLGTYNVKFVKGDCWTVFKGCSRELFTFHTAADAKSASQALLDQVFVGIYDDLPELSANCDTFACGVTTPYELGSWSNMPTFYDYTAANWAAFFQFPGAPFSHQGYPDEVQHATWTSPWGINRNFAVWEAQEVPEPLSILLLAVGLGSMAATGRPKRS